MGNHMTPVIDTHCHLTLCKEAPDTLINRAKQARVSHIINVAINIASGLEGVALAKRHPEVVPTIGVHPCEVGNPDNTLSKLKDTLDQHVNSDTPFKALGEIGLDYFKMYNEVSLQKTWFISQLDLASEYNLPVIIHNRHADEDIIAILKDYSHLTRVLHCYSSSIDTAEKLYTPNTYFSFTGNITYSKKGKTINALKQLPLSKIMIETDSPYLTPNAHKGISNEPSFVIEIAKKIADVKDISLEDVCYYTTLNAKTFFNL